MGTQAGFDSLHRFVVALTVMAILGGLMVPKALVELHLYIFGIALILAGVPHGATDFFLYSQIGPQQGSRVRTAQFLVKYLLFIVAYLLVWWLFPIIALSIFLGVSAYHFGESNWPHVHFPHTFSEKLTMLLWGSAVTGVPVLLHFGQASAIIFEMTGWQPVLEPTTRAALIFLLIFGTLGNTVQLFHRQHLTLNQFKNETGNFLLLMLLFFTTPLLVGFGIYFVLWHSLGSMNHQIRVVKSTHPSFGIRKYLRTTVPLSLLAFAGLGILYFFFGTAFGQGQNLGVLFLFISVITVPHAVQMEWLYRVGKPVMRAEKSMVRDEAKLARNKFASV